MVNPRYQTPQGQSVAKPGTLLQNILDGNLNMTQRSPKVTCSGQTYDGPMFNRRFYLCRILIVIEIRSAEWIREQSAGTHCTKRVSINMLTGDSLIWIRVK